MHTLVAAIKFGVHRIWFAGRDLLQPPMMLVSRVGIKPGDRVVDYGCGAGSYALPAAVLAGPAGHVFAVDENPHAIRHVQRAIRAQGASNLTVIHTDGVLPLPSQTVDVVLLYDVIHDVSDQQGLLAELHRVLQPQGLLSVRDHHHSEQRLRRLLAERGLFRFVTKTRGGYRFAPAPPEPAPDGSEAREALAP